jgi:hypothetical protein
MSPPFRAISIAVVTLCLSTSVKAEDLTLDQITMAEIIDGAMFAADKCPGLQLIRSSIRANADSAGLTPEQVSSSEWKKAMALSEINAKEGHAKDPAGLCERMWHFLGPDHPGMVKHTLLTRD